MSTLAPSRSLRALIVDDEPLARDVIRRLAQARDDLELCGEASSGAEALERLERAQSDGAPIDLLFLDIRMPGLDGFDTLERLSKGDAQAPSVVFVTAYDRYAVRAFETQAIDYLLKPVTPARFEKAMERCLEERRRVSPQEVRQLLGDSLLAPPDRLLVKRGAKIVPVPVDSVDWIEANGDYVRLHCGDTTHLLERTLQEMERLLEAQRFRRIHRSALVNEARVSHLRPLGSGRYEMELEDGTRLVMSRSYAARYKRSLL